MNDQERKDCVLLTLATVCSIYAEQGKANAIITTRDGEVNPERAVIELIREITALAQ